MGGCLLLLVDLLVRVSLNSVVDYIFIIVVTGGLAVDLR